MLSYTVRVSTSFIRFLQVIEEVGHGEIYAVDLASSDRVEAEITGSARSLWELVRAGSKIEKLLIHDGQPAFAEIDCEIGGFRCRKKIKLT